MKLIVGLGNPEKKYENTRHNVGYFVVDKLRRVFDLKTQNSRRRRGSPKAAKLKSMIFVKTGVFMNESGKAVKKLITNHHSLLTDLYVVHDDLDIPLGKYKIQFGKGPHNHKGVGSVEEELKTEEFWRIRVGIENRVQGSGDRVPGEIYTLQDFLPEERGIIDHVISEIKEKLESGAIH